MVKKPRQANIELLRIISMLMVLGLHANFMTFHGMTSEESTTLFGLCRIFMQALCIIAVDVFVMISGWFGIKPSIKGFCNFMWQVIFIIGLSIAVESFISGEIPGVKTCLKVFGLYGGGGWFVAAYMCLYILSQLINSFLEKASSRSIEYFLIGFFTYEIIFGDTLSTEYIICGYSPISFIGLYVLAAYLRRRNYTVPTAVLIAVFLTAMILNSAIWFITNYRSMIAIRDLVFNYINPLVIIQAATLLLIFSRICIEGRPAKVINYMAASCFAAYLLHVGTAPALDFYVDTVRKLMTSYGTLAVGGFIIAVYLFSFVIDQPRKFIWNKLVAPCFNKTGGGNNLISNQLS